MDCLERGGGPVLFSKLILKTRESFFSVFVRLKSNRGDSQQLWKKTNLLCSHMHSASPNLGGKNSLNMTARKIKQQVL